MALPVRLFIARSFSETDEGIVGYFTKHLDQYRDLGVEWFDARPGKTGSTRAKVMECIASADVFLGIFTRRNELKPGPRPRDLRRVLDYFLRLRQPPTQWVGSAWTFQESGYSIAKDLDTIFLVEEGVSDIGGLQGDIAVIQFSRTSPGAALGELTGQLNSILAKYRGAVEAQETAVTAEGHSASVASAATAEQDLPPASETHQAATSTSAYANMIVAFMSTPPDFDAAKQELERGLTLTTDIDEQHFLEIEYFERQIAAGVLSGHDGILRLAETHPTRRTLFAAAQRYEALGEFSRARSLCEQALEASESTLGKSVVIRLMASVTARCGQAEQAYSMLVSAARDSTLSDWAKHSLFLALADRAKQEDRVLEEISWLEMAVGARPEENAPRFRLAFLCSAQGREEQALRHYRVLEQQGASPAALNNLGVSYMAVGLKGMGIAAYEAASAQGESLAMANRANELVSAGFFAQADSLLVQACKLPEVSGRVGVIRGKLEQAQEKEAERYRTIEKDAEDQRAYFLAYAQGMLDEHSPEEQLRGVWRTQHGNLVIEVTGTTLRGTCERAGVASDLGASAWEMLTAQALSQPARVIVRLELVATIRGLSGAGRLTKSAILIKGDGAEGEPRPSQTEEINCSFVLVNGMIHMEERSDKKGRVIRQYARVQPI